MKRYLKLLAWNFQKSDRRNERPSAAKAEVEKIFVIAAVNRCATQKQECSANQKQVPHLRFARVRNDKGLGCCIAVVGLSALLLFAVGCNEGKADPKAEAPPRGDGRGRSGCQQFQSGPSGTISAGGGG